jgi:YtfJ family uncharacterized protein
MKMMWGLLAAVFFVTQTAWAGLEMGQVPPEVELKEKLGGRIDGTPWSSNELKGKVHVIFYVDPDEKDLNNEASEALKAENFPRDTFQSIGIINMAATILPNFLISSSLKKKQKQYPTTVYVRDYEKTLVKAWGIADDNSDIIAFDKAGRLIYYKGGKLEADDIKQLLQVIKENLDK